MKDKIKKIIKEALQEFDLEVDPLIEIPPQKEFGDYSTAIAMSLAKKLKKSPLEIANLITAKINDPIIEKVTVVKPGFMNFFITKEALIESLKRIIEQKESYGSSKEGQRKRVLLEFVSANPTGPLHIGHGRWAVLGDVLANLLDFVGFKVEREFYLNDTGRQINLLVGSVRARKEGREIPDGGYGGEYVKEIAAELKDDLSEEKIIKTILEKQKETLATLRVEFDNWFSEKSLHEEDLIKKAIARLDTYEKEGALWFSSTKFSDDKDRVLVRSDGDTTYFAADVAYHLNKFERGFDRLINIWGTDHHGYVARVKAAIKSLGLDESKLEIMIGQLVSLFRNGEPVRMSKRTGEMITLSEVMDEIGVDATRYFLVMLSVNTHLDFDMTLATEKSMENPVYYLQYAYARIANIFKEEKILSFSHDQIELNHEKEFELIKKLIEFEDLILVSALNYEPHRLCTYLKELAAIFHSFYHECRVVGNPSRLSLCLAVQIVLRNGLKLLGVSAPERM